MKRSLIFGTLFILANFCYPFTIEVKINNISDIPVSCSISLVRSYTDEYGNWWPHFGYVTKDGLVKQKQDIKNFIQPGTQSDWIKLPADGRVLVCTKISEKPVPVGIDVKLIDNENTISKSFVIPETQETYYIYLYTVPSSPGPIKIEPLSAQQIVEKNLEIVKQATENKKSKLPSKIAIYTDCHLLPTDPSHYRKSQYKLLRELGINGIMCAASDLLPEIIDNGFLYLRSGGASISYNDYYKTAEEIKPFLKNGALNQSGIFERYNLIEKVRNLKLGDEILSGLLQEYLACGEKTRVEIIDYLKEKHIPLSDLNVSSYQEISIKPAAIMKMENPGLYYWTNRIRMERINSLWKCAMEVNKKYFPSAWGSPNWPVGGYLDGTYEGQGWDLWHLYKNKFLDGIWGEDWPGYEVWLRGGNAFLVDMMRCQAKGLPMGIYNVVETDYSPVYARYKFYEQLINGITEIFWYSYGCLRGNESNPWEIKPDIVREIALLNREAGEAEEYLLNTALQPASVAILWTPAQEIWDPEYHVEIMALYYILLHSNYAVDFISSYDVESGDLEKYKVLYIPFNYVEKNVWKKIKKWVEEGGFVVIEGAYLKDECNRNIDLGLWIKGFSSQIETKTQSIGRLPLELSQQKVLDITGPVNFPVVCLKSNISVPENGKTILTYKDGSPAAVQVKKGKGSVRIVGFLQGISYVFDQEKKDRAKWGDVLLYHSFSPDIRKFVLDPVSQSNIQKVCNIDQDLIIARKRTGKTQQCIAIFDYGFGSKKPVMPVWSEIGQTTIDIEIKDAKNIKCLNGNIKKGKNTYTITFQGVAMLLIDK
ncbi:MAG TPA: beta-galactosidase trimerization domain-containing protein [bacterium]|nr:beta-galactosidase trimerization domain-containing protein [bacterium]HOL35186.1 beta-galactosidase trimerization domain-containing protein [bacterium]HPP08621.1 beta-galactosidase trimerization domain-containing protein [bacterium]